MRLRAGCRFSQGPSARAGKTLRADSRSREAALVLADLLRGAGDAALTVGLLPPPARTVLVRAQGDQPGRLRRTAGTAERERP